MAHPHTRIVYGYRLTDDDGDWRIEQFEAGGRHNGFTDRFTMPWFTDMAGPDLDAADVLMARPADLFNEHLSDQGVTAVQVYESVNLGEGSGDMVLGVSVFETPEEGVWELNPAAVVGSLELLDSRHSLVEAAREKLGISFTDPGRPAWYAIVSYE